MTVKSYRPREVTIHALELVEGTTKGEILDFCPDANVGAKATDDDLHGLSSSDLWWVEVPTAFGETVARYGCYISKGVTGSYFVSDAENFHRIYEEL